MADRTLKDELVITCEEVEQLCMANLDELINKILAMEAAAQKLRAENEEIRKDAERLEIKAALAQEDLAATKGACGAGTPACRLWHRLRSLVALIKEGE